MSYRNYNDEKCNEEHDSKKALTLVGWIVLLTSLILATIINMFAMVFFFACHNLSC